MQQQDLAVDHAVADHAAEDGDLRPYGADAVGLGVGQGLLIHLVEVTQSLVHLLAQLPRVAVELRRLYLRRGRGRGGEKEKETCGGSRRILGVTCFTIL